MGLDVTGDLGAKITAAMAALPAEVQPLIQTLMDRLDALETKSAADAANLANTALAAESSAEDKLLAAVKPISDLAPLIADFLSAVKDRGILLSIPKAG